MRISDWRSDVCSSDLLRRLIEDLREEWRALDDRIGAFDAELVAVTRHEADCRRLCEIPGFGALNATALVAVGNASAFARGRDQSGRAACRERVRLYW